MILLDTDHLTVLRFRTGERCLRLVAKMEAATSAGEIIGTSVVNLVEQMKGWLAAINKERQALRQVLAYQQVLKLFEFYSSFHVAPFDETAAIRFDEFRKARIRVGTSDLKIASVAICNNALLLTANRQDFEQVPGLRFENWLD